MKKTIMLFMALALIIAFCSVSAYADGAELILDSCEAEPGAEIVVPLHVVGNPGIISAEFSVVYDANALEWIGVQAGDYSGTIGDYELGIGQSVAWFARDERTDITQDGVFITLRFKIVENTEEQSTQININYDPDNIFNADFANVYFSVVPSVVTIKNTSISSYTVTFNANGGTGEMAAQTFTIDIPQTLTANAFTRTGYTFAGWAASANGEVLYTDRQSVKNLSSTPGATVNLYAVWTPITEPAFAGYSLRLSGILGLKYYMALPENFNGSDAYMTFTIKGKTQTVPFSESYEENGYRVFECSVYAYQMADDIEAAFHYDGETITDTYPIKQYLESIQEGDYSGEAKILVNTARAYSHFIQIYLADVNGWTYGEKYKALDYDGSVSVDAARDGSEDYKYNLSVWDTDKIASASYKLYLNADTILRVEVTLNNTPADTVKVTVDGTETAATVTGSTYRVEIPDIAANALGVRHTIVMTVNDSEVFNISLSAMSFANTVLTLSQDQNELNAMAAMYEYYIAANNYMN